MKKHRNLMQQICSLDNLYEAADKAAKGKRKNPEVVAFYENIDTNLLKIQQLLLSGKFKTSKYHLFTIYEPKERIIYKLPFYPDRIVHHAIMNVLEPIWVKIFTSNTYACIKNRGIHAVNRKLIRDLHDIKGTEYCLKLDIKKFYPNIDHTILKLIIRQKIADNKLLQLLDGIIDSADGVPIGNYLSQFFANLYLAYFDHWVKEVLKVKYYYRYADDIVILSDNKTILWTWFRQIKQYLKNNLKLEIKSNYQVFPVESRGIDFVGYIFRHGYAILRKSIKLKILRQLRQGFVEHSYFGWLKYCHSKHFLFRIERQIGINYSNWRGKQVRYKWLRGKVVNVVNIEDRQKYFLMQFTYKGKPYFYKSISKKLRNALQIAHDDYRRGTYVLPIFG